MYRPRSLRPSCLRVPADQLLELIMALWGKERKAFEYEGHRDFATVSQHISSMLFSIVSFKSSTWKRYLIMIKLKTDNAQTPNKHVFYCFVNMDMNVNVLPNNIINIYLKALNKQQWIMWIVCRGSNKSKHQIWLNKPIILSCFGGGFMISKMAVKYSQFDRCGEKFILDPEYALSFIKLSL